MSWIATAIIGGAVIGGVVQHKAAGKAADAQQGAAQTAANASDRASLLQIEELRAAREESLALRQPFIDLGKQAVGQFQNALAPTGQRLGELDGAEGELIPAGNALQAPTLAPLTVTPFQQNFSDPMAQLSEINPIVSFLREQGFDAIQESAAAGGRLGAGDTLKDLARFDANLNSTLVPGLQQQRFGQELAQNDLAFNQGVTQFNQGLQANQQQLNAQQQGYNQLFNLATLGGNAAAGAGSNALASAGQVSNVLGANAANVGNAALVGGNAAAQGYLNQSNAFTGTLSNLAGVAGAFPSLFGGGAPAVNTAAAVPHSGFGLPQGAAASAAFPALF